MKITAIEAIPVRVPLTKGMTTKTAHGDHVTSDYVIVRVKTDAGLEGLGEATVQRRGAARRASRRPRRSRRSSRHDRPRPDRRGAGANLHRAGCHVGDPLLGATGRDFDAHPLVASLELFLRGVHEGLKSAGPAHLDRSGLGLRRRRRRRDGRLRLFGGGRRLVAWRMRGETATGLSPPEICV